ncbi:AAA family ATPase [Nodosilinea sp. P-1105]|uniref:AAA family ATPase n=1 Tax=Nodosilinea sp. P-1105 TaxID=2546229 RepID=UPI00146E5D0A|nr:AAA family ATPase [Nodosilinea sp. P-1105]NMF84173.1 ATP-binding protein [Nodosilinea sp. P-1105]
MPRSVALHPDHKQAVAIALERNGFLTQGDLAAHLEIALSTVSNFCRGVKVSIAKFEEIAEALGLEPRELILAREEASSAPEGDASPMTFYAYDEGWVGREALVSELAAQVQGSCRLLVITGIAGVGKTALAERLSLELAGFGVPLRETVEAQEQGADFGSFAARMLERLGEAVTPSERADRSQLLARLVRALQSRRQLLLIDSLEEWLQGNEQEGWSEFKDEGFLQFFQQVLAADNFQSRIILTSQELPSQLLAVGTRYRNHWATQLLTGLSASEQLALFDKTGLSLSPDADGYTYLVRTGQAYEGHPLALRVIAGEIGSRPYFGNVVAYWQRYRQEIEAVENAIAAAAAGQAIGADDRWQLDRFTRTLRRNVRQRLEHTFQRLRQEAKFAYILLCEAAVYRCAVPEDWWLSHLDYWDCTPEKGHLALDALRDRFLVEEAICPGQGFANKSNGYTLRQHSLIRSVALEHFQHLDELV